MLLSQLNKFYVTLIMLVENIFCLYCIRATWRYYWQDGRYAFLECRSWFAAAWTHGRSKNAMFKFGYILWNLNRHNGNVSEIYHANSRVPQGSNLGPFLIIFIKDHPSVLRHMSFFVCRWPILCYRKICIVFIYK